MIRTHVQRLVEGRTLALGLLFAALVAASLLFASSAHAATTFIVNNTGDPGDGNCTAGGCTLREAITAANETPGVDTIDFDISGSGVKTISPASSLPPITEAVTIDGYTQPGSSPNTRATGALDANILVELNGSGAGRSSGIIVLSSDVVVRGLAVNRFFFHGVQISRDTENVKVEGNYIGTDPSGTLDRGNAEDGVVVFGVAGGEGGRHSVGGLTPGERNLISGNDDTNLRIFDAPGNTIRGNLIGVQEDGSTIMGGSEQGVAVTNSANNAIGGAEPEAANTIASSTLAGVKIFGQTSTGNRILGNSIFASGEMGIDLRSVVTEPNGRTANDPRDRDRGANTVQNFPEITSARKSSSGTTTVKAALESTPSTKRKKKSFTIQLFSNPSGEDEGKTFLGQKRVATNLRGKVSFSFQTSKPVAVGDRITATATGKGGTSEFSDPVDVDLAPGRG
jgi:CSLREA domain-containing protein